MADKKKKEHPYIVVYVYAPERYKDDYMKGISIPNVKIGETYSDKDDCLSCMEVSMKRINLQSTGFKEYMYLLLWFVFPYKKGTDDAIRKILTEDIYHLQTSKNIDKNKVKDRRTTKIGLEFAYNINITLVNTAISVYKLKAKMEELINDRGIDDAFKRRLKNIVNELIKNLDEVIEESAHNINNLPLAELQKILFQELSGLDLTI